MLRRIPAHRVSVGMYVHRFEGSWFDHPFWRTRLLVGDEVLAARIRAAGFAAVVIDENRGIAASFPPDCEAPSIIVNVAEPMLPSLGPGEAQAEAGKLIERTKGVIYALYDQAHRGIAPSAATLEPLVRDITQCVQRSREVLHHLGLMKKKDEYTFLHSVSVCAYMVNFARELGFDDDGVMRLGMAGLMHDLGKTEIDDAILMKPGRLTAEELEIIREHPRSGHALLQKSQDLPEEVLNVCLQHHERLDGKGYPHGLIGEQISLSVRMSTICDVYDALTSERPYKEAWLPARALREMRNAPGQFDQCLVERFELSLLLAAPRSRPH